jgi:hypothetical protein
MPARPPASDLKILIAAAAVTLLLSIASFLVAPVDSASYVTGSSYSPRADGAKAAFLMLKESGYAVERSFEPLTALRRSPERTVLILAAPVEGPSQQDIRVLRHFVEAGGIVLTTDRSGGEFLPGVPAPGPRDAFPEELTTVSAAIASPLTTGVPRIEVHRASKSLASASQYVTVYGDDASPAVVMARLGSGTAVWWADSWPLTNEGISASGHAELLLNLVGAPGARTVLWDEHYHGHARSLWSYIAGTPLPFVGLQMLLLSLAAVLAWSRRKWPIRHPVEVSRTSPLEFVDSMGALYERAGVARAAIATARARTRRDLIAAVRAPSATADAALARMVADRAGVEVPKIEGALAMGSEGATGADVDDAAAVRIVAELQRIAAAARSIGPRASQSGEQDT